MRADPPRVPARPAATGSNAGATGGSPLGAADEARWAPVAGDASTRRRDDAGGRRSASASRLMNAVTRHLLDDEEDRVGGDARESGGGVASASTASVDGGGGKSSTRASGAAGVRGGTRQPPGLPVRRAGSSSRRAATPEDDVWSQQINGADEPGRAVGPEGRIQPGRGVSRIEGVRPDAAPRIGGSPRMRVSSWGALLAAVAVLVVVIAAGWFDLTPSGRSDDAGDGGGRQERTAAR